MTGRDGDPDEHRDAANDRDPRLSRPPSADREPAPIGHELDLMAYMDGELEPAKMAEVELRLKTDDGYAARYRALMAVSGFLREDADRIYDGLQTDGMVDAIMAKISAAHHSDKFPRSVQAISSVRTSHVSDVPPATSRQMRNKKNTVIWVAFGSVAAAAAGLFLYVRSHETPQTGPAAANTQPAVTETVAQVKTASPPPSHTSEPRPIAESSAVEVEDLEVGQGATVIYTREGGGQNTVVWISNEKPTEKPTEKH